MDKSKLNQVVDALKKEGYSDEDVAKLVENLTKDATAKFYTEALAAFSDEDMKAIEECPSQEQANFEIRTRYSEKTGKNPDVEVQRFIDTFAQGFLDAYHKDKQAQTQ